MELISKIFDHMNSPKNMLVFWKWIFALFVIVACVSYLTNMALPAGHAVFGVLYSLVMIVGNKYFADRLSGGNTTTTSTGTDSSIGEEKNQQA